MVGRMTSNRWEVWTAAGAVRRWPPMLAKSYRSPVASIQLRAVERHHGRQAVPRRVDPGEGLVEAPHEPPGKRRHLRSFQIRFATQLHALLVGLYLEPRQLVDLLRSPRL